MVRIEIGVKVGQHIKLVFYDIGKITAILFYKMLCAGEVVNYVLIYAVEKRNNGSLSRNSHLLFLFVQKPKLCIKIKRFNVQHTQHSYLTVCICVKLRK